MSPTAIGGPHSRATSINTIGPVSTTNGDGINGADGMKSMNRTFPHLDELVDVKPDIEPGSSIRKLLQAGELAAKQAETYLDFRRPDLALKEYIIASIIAVDYIPRSTTYHELQAERGELYRSYVGLKKRINVQHSKFEEVKDIIKENNRRTGIESSKPDFHGKNGNGQFLVSKNGDNLYADATMGVQDNTQELNGSKIQETRPKPPIQPKPQNLLGKSIQATNGSLNSLHENDLATRFARLRSVNSTSPTQDPRIRTQQISGLEKSSPMFARQSASIVRPLGPRDMPSVSAVPLRADKPVLDMVTNIPTMPRPPDAVYSPARSVDTVISNSQPPLVSRGSSYLGVGGKRDSMISTPKPNRSPVIADDRTNRFSPPDVDSYDSEHHSRSEYGGTSRGPSIPNSTTLSAQQLYEYLKMGSHNLSLLIVDVRDRGQFDDGHIMTQSIICIEPISLRDDMSAEDLGDRMVLSPETEQRLYNQRHNFDLVVYYDQSSTSTNMVSSSLTGSNYLEHFSRIIYDHAYDHQLKRRPMLLAGGLDAWVDIVGMGALQSSVSSISSSEKSSNHNKPLGRVSVVRDVRHPKRLETRSRTLSEAEELKWDEDLRNRADEDNFVSDGIFSDEAFYAKTTEDFLRRYPELPSTKQSMALPSIPRSMLRHEEPTIPAHPTRPPPALPRQRSNGIYEKTEITSYAMTGGPPPPRFELGLCGLFNTNGATCYMNSAIQAISASPALRNFLVNYRYPLQEPPPAKDGEPGPPRQLMTRNLSSLLQHMWCGKYNEVVPKMFTAYVHATHARHSSITHARTSSSTHSESNRAKIGYADVSTCFGSQRQHDSGEFFNWLITILEDENNINRNVDSPASIVQDSRLPLLRACRRTHEQYSKYFASEFSQLFTVETIEEYRCPYCNDLRRISDRTPILWLPVPPSQEETTLDALLSLQLGDERIEVNCESCGRVTHKGNENYKQKSTRCSYLPNYLTMFFKRGMSTQRINTRVSFPETLDMGPWTWLSDQGDLSERVLPEQRPPFNYQCYAAILHGGTQAGGHYKTMVRRIDHHNRWTNEWHEFNDSQVTGGKTFGNLQSQGVAVTALFYRREGVA